VSFVVPLASKPRREKEGETADERGWTQIRLNSFYPREPAFIRGSSLFFAPFVSFVVPLASKPRREKEGETADERGWTQIRLNSFYPREPAFIRGSSLFFAPLVSFVVPFAFTPRS
jgi:hypothetical protein